MDCHVGGDDGAPVIPRTAVEFRQYLLDTALSECFDQKLVVPGDLENSALVKLLEQTCEDPNLVMPLAPFPLLPEEIEDVKSWIAAGAEE